MLYLAQIALAETEVTTEAFFGYMGVTCALVFASDSIENNPTYPS